MKNTCFACGEQKTSKSLLYDMKTFRTYCRNEFICKNPHKRPPEDNLADLHEDAVKEFHTKEDAETFSRMLGKTAAVRLSPYLIMHVINTAKEFDLGSVNETLLFILDRDFKTVQEVTTTFKPIPKPEPKEEPISLDSKEEETETESIETVEETPAPAIEPEPIQEPKQEVEEDNDDFEI